MIPAISILRYMGGKFNRPSPGLWQDFSQILQKLDTERRTAEAPVR